MNTFDDKGSLDSDGSSIKSSADVPVSDSEGNAHEIMTKVTAQSAKNVSLDIQKSADSQPDIKKKKKKKYNTWWLKVTVISFVLAAFFSFLSDLTASAEQIVIVVLLLAFLILASILFDAIGVAVTSCDVTPIISMASRKVHGAKTAMWLVKNSSTVSSICNDVIGDIFGIISGACSAAVVVRIVEILRDSGETWQSWLTIIISAIVSALTIGGKAFMKNIAINNSKDFVMFVARILAVFNKEERKIRKKASAHKKLDKSKNKQSDSTDGDETR